MEAGGLRILRTGRPRYPALSPTTPSSPLGRPSRGATIRGRKGAREAAKGSDRYNRNAHTFKKQNSEWNFEGSRIDDGAETPPVEGRERDREREKDGRKQGGEKAGESSKQASRQADRVRGGWRSLPKGLAKGARARRRD